MARPFPPLSPFLCWPPFFAKLPVSMADALRGLERSGRWPADEVASGQRSQRMLLLEWAAQNVPYYREQGALAAAVKVLRGAPERFDEEWSRLPLLSKATLRSDGPRLNATSLPNGHLPLGVVRTSGSTGIPVAVQTTKVTRTIWHALAVLDHLWQQRNFAKRLGVIRSFKPAEGNAPGIDNPDWGPPAGVLFRTGPSSVIHVSQPVEVLIAWLRRFDPHYLLTYPAVAAAIFEALGPAGKPPALEELRLISEPVDADFEARVKSDWGVRISDIYSTNENGKIAMRCREHDRLHVQHESIYVEILDDAGGPCAAGETGQVVLTSLHNLATPLIRYQIGDYATVGELCACGRTSPVIGKVLGRVRNMATSPDGRRFYPISLYRIRAVPAIRQAQWIQTARDAVELRAVLDRPLTESETGLAQETVRETLGHPYRVEIVPVDSIARGPTGKFEEFISLLE